MSDPIAFSATSTLQDVLDSNRILAKRNKPKGKLSRWRRPLFFGACLILGLAVGVMSGDGDKIAFLTKIFTTTLGLQFLALLAAFVLLWSLGGLAMRWWTKTITRSAYADNRRRRPDVADNDTALPMTRRYVFDESGMTTSTEVDELWEGWPRITGIEQTERLLLVVVGKGAAYPIPRNALSADLEDQLIDYIASRSNSKWPF